MKKKLSYRDKLLELAYIYNVKEIQDYTKNRKNLTTGQIELILKKNKILNGIPNEKNFYFVHSYHFLPEKKEDIIAKTNYSEDINAIVASKNIYGIQAHPEKSQYYGLKLLKNFCRFCFGKSSKS